MEYKDDSETVSYHAPDPADLHGGVIGPFSPVSPEVTFVTEASSGSLNSPGFQGFVLALLESSGFQVLSFTSFICLR